MEIRLFKSLHWQVRLKICDTNVDKILLMIKFGHIFLLFHQGGGVSALPEDNHSGEGLQTGISKERAGEGHPEDGKVATRW